MGRPRELEGGEDERREHNNRAKCDQHHALLEAAMGVRAGARRVPAAGAERLLCALVADDVARVVLVDVELAVQAEILGVGAQEALDVRLGGKQLELLVLEGAQVLAADLGALLRLGDVDLPAEAGFAQTCADLEHGPSVELLAHCHENPVEADREARGDAQADAE